MTAESETDALKARIRELEQFYLHIDDDARKHGLTYDSVRDVLSRYMTEDEDKQISFGKMVEELRSMARVAAEGIAGEACERSLRFLLDKAGIEARERDSCELVELRAKIIKLEQTICYLLKTKDSSPMV